MDFYLLRPLGGRSCGAHAFGGFYGARGFAKHCVLMFCCCHTHGQNFSRGAAYFLDVPRAHKLVPKVPAEKLRAHDSGGCQASQAMWANPPRPPCHLNESSLGLLRPAGRHGSDSVTTRTYGWRKKPKYSKLSLEPKGAR